jgi:hypothetical protein
MTVHKGCGGPVIWCVDDTAICTRCHAHGLTLEETEQVPHPLDELSNFELIEQGLLRLDPETRREVIAAMLVVQRASPGGRAALIRVLAAPRWDLPLSWMISSSI